MQLLERGYGNISYIEFVLLWFVESFDVLRSIQSGLSVYNDLNDF